MSLRSFSSSNILWGFGGQSAPNARAGCAPFARRGEIRGLREALILVTAPGRGRSA